jgi:hypothetical protein
MSKLTLPTNIASLTQEGKMLNNLDNVLLSTHTKTQEGETTLQHAEIVAGFLGRVFYPIAIFVVFACMMFFASSDAKAIPANAGASGLTCNCEPCNHWFKTCKCCSNNDGTVWGHANGIVTLLTNCNIADFGSLSDLKRDNIYVGDTSNPGNGIGYMNVPIATDTISGALVLLIEADRVIVCPTSDEGWDEILEHLNNASYYTDAKVLVYPNPTSNIAFIKLLDNYISTFNVQSISIGLYKDDVFIATLTTNNVNDIIVIDDSKISTNGTYYAICNIEFKNAAGIINTDIVTVPFVVFR